jgi:8-oxo-dGTP pyrophosphatase MutT (NUDIX family)
MADDIAYGPTAWSHSHSRTPTGTTFTRGPIFRTTPAEAAVREFREETGVAIDVASVGAPVAVTRGEWTFRGQRLYSVDWFFAWRGPRFEPSTIGWSALEQELHAAWHWWKPDHLERTSEAVLPADLAAIARRIASGSETDVPIELPWLVFE